MLPDAHNPAAFWRNVCARRMSVRPLEDGDWHWPRYLHAAADVRDRLATVHAAAVEGFRFDWQRFRMPPAEVQENNPIALMIVDAGAQALDEVKSLPHETTGVFIGAASLGLRKETGQRVRLPDLLAATAASPTFAALPAERREALLADVRAAFEASLRAITKDTAASVLASVAPGRLAMAFNLRGMHYAVDASFASALAALEAGVRSLREGTLDLALVGAASETLCPREFLSFHALGLLGRDRVSPFDANAGGTLLGEGVTMFALKRVTTALADGDTIHALVRGVGGASDGAMQDGRLAAMKRAYLDADVAPRSVAYIECDADGNLESDLLELAALRRLRADEPQGRIALGSAKANVGHLRAGAAGAGLLRAVLALEHGLIPPQASFETAHRALELDASPFHVPRQTMPFAHGVDAPARAAVQASGLGGVHYHAVLERWDPAVPSATSRPVSNEPIAIVGVGAWMPGAPSVPAFDELLAAGRDMTTQVPQSKWPVERYFDATRTEGGGGTYSRLGAFAATPPLAPRWGIPESELAGIDPGHLMVLHAAEEALGGAGFEERRWNRMRTAVAIGHMPYTGRRFLADARAHWIEYQTELEQALQRAGLAAAECRAVLDEAEAHFKRDLPPLSRHGALGMMGNQHATRLARLLDLRGVAVTIDSACASSLAAVHAAVQALRHRACDVAIVGGVSADLQPEYYVLCCRFNGLSDTGLKPFDAAADGFVPGEGAGVVVLRRFADAEREGERIHAVIRSVAGSSDGRGRSVLAPRPEGEALAMQLALQAAGVDPASVDYVECHGAGTALGDPTEVQAMTSAYGSGRPRPLLLGSVKSNIGHLNGGAGVAALIKAVLAVRDGVIPATLKSIHPNPAIDFAAGPTEVVTSRRDWRTHDGQPRRAGVSSFGVGGSNFHVVVEQHVVTDPALPILYAEGETPEASLAVLRRAVERLAASPDALLEVAASTRVLAARGLAHRTAIVVADLADAQRKLVLAEKGVRGSIDWDLLARQGIYAACGADGAQLALLFPGQGGHYPRMLGELAKFPTVAAVLSEADAIYRGLAGRALSDAFLRIAADDIADEDAHCATLVVNVALARLLASYGIRPTVLLGQSAGELAAHVVAERLTLAEALGLMRARTLAVAGVSNEAGGCMVALTCSSAKAAEFLPALPGYAAIAADNSPSSCIVSATRDAADALVARCAAGGIECQVLAVSHGYHSQLIAAAQPTYREALARIAFRPARCATFSSVLAEPVERLPSDAIAGILAQQLVTPVRMREAIEALYQGGCRLFLQCGPKKSLSSFADDTLAGREHSAEATLHPKIGELQQFARAVAWGFAHRADRHPVPPT